MNVAYLQQKYAPETQPQVAWSAQKGFYGLFHRKVSFRANTTGDRLSSVE